MALSPEQEHRLQQQRAAEAPRDTFVERLSNRVLDRGINTATRAFRPEHDNPERVMYVPSNWHVLPRALRHVGVSRNDTFIDFGCGKGRVVHQAARRRFGRVIGVEVSPELAEIARAALRTRSHQHRCDDVQIVVADVTDFDVPDDLTVAYLFHPFQGETLEVVLQNIADSIDRNPRRVRLIYVHPFYGDQVLRTKRFRLLKHQRGRHLNRASIYESC